MSVSDQKEVCGGCCRHANLRIQLHQTARLLHSPLGSHTRLLHHGSAAPPPAPPQAQLAPGQPVLPLLLLPQAMPLPARAMLPPQLALRLLLVLRAMLPPPRLAQLPPGYWDPEQQQQQRYVRCRPNRCCSIHSLPLLRPPAAVPCCCRRTPAAAGAAARAGAGAAAQGGRREVHMRDLLPCTDWNRLRWTA